MGPVLGLKFRRGPDLGHACFLPFLPREAAEQLIRMVFKISKPLSHKKLSPKPFIFFEIKIQHTTIIYGIEISGDGGGRDVIDRSRDEGAIMEPKLAEQTATEEATGASAAGTGSGDDGGDKVLEIEDEPHRCAPMEELRTRITEQTVGPMVQLLDPSMAVEGTMITGGGFGGAGSSSSDGGNGDARSESPPRDSAKGKGLAVDTEGATEVLIRQTEFRSVVRSSRHKPITRGNFAELVDEVVLDRLLQDKPTVVATVLAAWEER